MSDGSRTYHERLEFERFVTSLSIQFINLPGDEVEDAIREALRRTGEMLDLDRCNFFRIEPDGRLVDQVGWQRDGVAPVAAPISGADRFPWALATVRAGRVVRFSNVDEIPNPIDRETYRSIAVRSAVTVPISVGGRLLGALGINAVRAAREWHDDTVHSLSMIASSFGSLLARRESERQLALALDTVKRLSEQLTAENTYLRNEAQERLGGHGVIGESAAIRDVLELARQVAVTDSTVLLLGETGSGKELIATEVHRLSTRQAKPMVRVNCSAIPATLIESELFGREKGAFTGASSRQVGRFELADQSTIFLDEIGELPADTQVKLLRVLEERQIERLGNPRPIRINARVIAATHRNLDELVAAGAFREDLFYRLNVFPIRVPALRERREDIPLLVRHFVQEFSRQFRKRIDRISDSTMAALRNYAWPGNIRELRNVVERAMIVATGTELTVQLPAAPAAPAGAGAAAVRMKEVEASHLRAVVESTGWRIRGAGGAAERLGLKPTTLESRLRKLGIDRPRT